MSRAALLMVVLVGCGGGDAGGPDADGPADAARDDGDPAPDADPGADAPEACAPGAWTSEVLADFIPLEQSGTTTLGAIAVDSQGGLHVAAVRKEVDVTMSRVWYLHRSPSGSWTMEDPGTGTNANAISIAVAPDGAVHIAYSAETFAGVDSVHYAHKPAGGVWQLAMLDEGNTDVQGPSLAIDPAGVVHAVWIHDGDLFQASRVPPAAFIRGPEIDDSFGLAFDHPTLGVDASGGQHVVYKGSNTFAEFSRVIKHAHRPSGGSWSTVDLITGLAVFGEEVRGTNDAQGDLHLVTFTRGPGAADDQLVYRRKPAGQPLQAAVPIATLEGHIMPNVVAGGGGLHVIALGPEHAGPWLSVHDVVYVHKTSAATTWQVDTTPFTVTATGFGPRRPPYAVGASGDVHFTFRVYEDMTGNAKYRHGYACP